MKNRTKLNATMNIVIVTAALYYFLDPEITNWFTKIHLSIAALFSTYKILKK